MNEAHNNRLSAGARARLAELTSEIESQVIAEAARLNPNDILTARDIGDGFQATLRGGWVPGNSADQLARRFQWSRVLMLCLACAALAALGAGAISIIGASAEDGNKYLDLTTGALSLMAALVAVSIAFIAVRESRLSRGRALLEAEGADGRVHALDFADTHDEIADAPPKEAPALLPTFIDQWARLDDRLRRLAQVALAMHKEIAADYPIGGLLRRLVSLGVLDKKRGLDLQEVLDIRNQVAHGRAVSPLDLSVGIRLMERLEMFLDDNITEHSPTT
jgi:hypothetical protein